LSSKGYSLPSSHRMSQVLRLWPGRSGWKTVQTLRPLIAGHVVHLREEFEERGIDRGGLAIRNNTPAYRFGGVNWTANVVGVDPEMDPSKPRRPISI
jgi:hypothetical protein